MRDFHTARAQGDEEMTVTVASKALNVDSRGIYHAKTVLSKDTPEEIAGKPGMPYQGRNGLGYFTLLRGLALDRRPKGQNSRVSAVS